MSEDGIRHCGRHYILFPDCSLWGQRMPYEYSLHPAGSSQSRTVPTPARSDYLYVSFPRNDGYMHVRITLDDGSSVAGNPLERSRLTDGWLGKQAWGGNRYSLDDLADDPQLVFAVAAAYVNQLIESGYLPDVERTRFRDRAAAIQRARDAERQEMPLGVQTPAPELGRGLSR